MDAVTPLVRRALDELTHGKAIQHYLHSDAVIHIPFSDDYNKDLFAKIVQAIQLRKPARVGYLNAANELKEYEFYSYLLMPSGQHLHLVGMSKPSQDAGFNSVNRLRLDQIQSFHLLKEQFKKPDFDVETYVDKHFGPFAGEGDAVTIRVQFSQDKAQYIRRTKRHSSQQTFDQANGSVIWQITAPLSEYLVSWIVSYGQHAKVLAPLELRKRVLEFAQGAIDANS
jgi:predicted DNA-binding transcriptional regulator YafY